MESVTKSNYTNKVFKNPHYFYLGCQKAGFSQILTVWTISLQEFEQTLWSHWKTSLFKLPTKSDWLYPRQLADLLIPWGWLLSGSMGACALLQTQMHYPPHKKLIPLWFLYLQTKIVLSTWALLFGSFQCQWEISRSLEVFLFWTGAQTYDTNVRLTNLRLKAVYCHPAYLMSTQSTSREMLGWMKHKLESRLPGEISITSDMQMTPPL